MSKFYYQQKQYCKETHWTQPSHLFAWHHNRNVTIELCSKCIYCHHMKTEIVKCDVEDMETAIQHAKTLGFRDAIAPF